MDQWFNYQMQLDALKHNDVSQKDRIESCMILYYKPLKFDLPLLKKQGKNLMLREKIRDLIDCQRWIDCNIANIAQQ